MSPSIRSNVSIGFAAIAGLVLATAPAAAQDGTLEVRARVGEVCSVNTATLDFGTYVNVQIFKSTDITIECITPTAVNVALDGGQEGNGNGIRKMKNNGSELIYQLFEDNGFSNSWDTGELVSSPIGTNHTVPVHGKIDPSFQAGGPLADGLYTDNVLITLSFL